MEDDGAAGACVVTYHTWRERLSILSDAARRLRPHAHRAPPRSTWNPFASSAPPSPTLSAHNGGSPSRAPPLPSAYERKQRHNGQQQQQQQRPASLAQRRFRTDEEMIAAVLEEFGQLLLGLRLDTRFSNSPSARVAEAQTLMARAAFHHEVQLHLMEKQQALRVSATQEASATSAAAVAEAAAASTSWPRGGAGDERPPPEEPRHRRRARYAQQQRDHLHAEAQDYLASCRLWLDSERERVRVGATTNDNALAFGVLCAMSACGVLLKDEVREEESPIPHALYDQASRAFHLTHTHSRFGKTVPNVATAPPSSPSPAAHQRHTNGEAGGGAAGGVLEDAWVPAREALTPGEGNVEGLLWAFPGLPIPPPHADERASAAPPRALSSCPSTGAAAMSFFVAWDDFPPTAPSRCVRLVHAVLMGLGATLEEAFGCYEMATNCYELAATVLLDGVPQWMWRWNLSDEGGDAMEAEDGSDIRKCLTIMNATY